MHTITMHDGVQDRIDDCIKHLGATQRALLNSATDYQEALANQKKALEQSESFLYSLARIIKSNKHDGDVVITMDTHSDKSFYFYHPKTGYCGGLNYFASNDRWSINT